MLSELVFKVEGMTCGGCASSIERGLITQPGVQKCKVNLVQKTAEVQTTLHPDIIKSMIEDLGFAVLPVTQNIG